MTVKTITGPSIQAALATAREELGDDVVLMESTPATADAPAEIAVMVDSAADPPVSDTSKGRVPKPPSDDGSLPVPDTDSGRTDAGTKKPGTDGSGTAGAGDEATGTGSFGYGGTDDGSSSRSNELPGRPSSSNGEGDGAAFSQVLARERGPGRGRVFPASGSQDGEVARGKGSAGQMTGSPSNGRDEARAVPQTEDEGRWTHHPLYNLLLDKGLRPETATQLFDELSDRRVALDGPTEDLRWALAQLLCRRIKVASPDQGPDNLVLLGPGGAGKTSMILKMATHDHLLDGGEPAVIHVQPTSDHGMAYQNPTSLYRRFGIAVQNVRTEEEMARALSRTESFGPVLVDTPPLSLPLSDSHAALRRIKTLLQPLRPLDAHFVLNTTRALENLDAAALSHLPVQPSAVSITHLDEAGTWGHVVEWLTTLDLPVQFVSEGPQVPTDARSFSLEWFVKDVMDL